MLYIDWLVGGGRLREKTVSEGIKVELMGTGVNEKTCSQVLKWQRSALNL